MDLLVSTRGSGLLGDFYTRKDIQVVRKRSAFRKRRAKAGKIVYPQVKGKSVRQQYLQQLEDPQIGSVIAGQQVAPAPPPIILGGESGFDRRQIESNLKRMLAEAQVKADDETLRRDAQMERVLAAQQQFSKLVSSGGRGKGTAGGVQASGPSDIFSGKKTKIETPRETPTHTLFEEDTPSEEESIFSARKVKERRASVASVAPLDLSLGLAAGSIHLNPMNRGLMGDDT